MFSPEGGLRLGEFAFRAAHREVVALLHCMSQF